MRDLHETLTRGGFRDDTHRAAVEAAHTERAWLEANIAKCRQMLANCGDDDIIAKMSCAGLIEKWNDRLDKVPVMPLAEPEEAADGKIEADARATKVEAEDGRVRASGAVGAGGPMGVRGLPYWDVFDRTAAMATDMVDAIYETARWTLASAGPLPLASTEPWVESDEEYRSRIQRHIRSPYGLGQYSTAGLNDLGAAQGLPRARLVPATTMQGEQA